MSHKRTLVGAPMSEPHMKADELRRLVVNR